MSRGLEKLLLTFYLLIIPLKMFFKIFNVFRQIMRIYAILLQKRPLRSAILHLIEFLTLYVKNYAFMPRISAYFNMAATVLLSLISISSTFLSASLNGIRRTLRNSPSSKWAAVAFKP